MGYDWVRNTLDKLGELLDNGYMNKYLYNGLVCALEYFKKMEEYL